MIHSLTRVFGFITAMTVLFAVAGCISDTTEDLWASDYHGNNNQWTVTTSGASDESQQGSRNFSASNQQNQQQWSDTSRSSSAPPDGQQIGGRSANAEQEIHKLLDEYDQALLNKDLAALDRIWADDLVFINPRGELLTKQDRMNNIKTGATAFKSIEMSDEQIRMYGQTAIATSRTDLEAQYSGQESSGAYNVTIVCARPKGTWQIVAVQMTPIAEK